MASVRMTIGATHYNATVTVSPNGESGSQIGWVVDFLPNELEPILSQVMDAGAAAMKATLENR